MTNTLILFESKHSTAKRIGEILGYVIGNTRVYSINDASSEVSKYQNIILVFSFYGSFAENKIKVYLSRAKEQLGDKKIIVVGAGPVEKDMECCVQQISGALGRNPDLSYFIQNKVQENKISQVDQISLGITNSCFEVAEKILSVLKECSSVLEKAKLKFEIDAFIQRHNTFALSTTYENKPRCSPVEYQYVDDRFYIITEGGMKFKGILSNGRVSAGIYDGYKSMNTVKGLQITGIAEVVPLFCDEYNFILKKRGIMPGNIKNLPVSLYLLKITPEKFEFLNAEFKNQGYDSKQIYTFMQKR